MIYLEEPAQALIYDSLPDPPDRHVMSQVFLSNLTEGGLDNVRFRVGTPFHYLRAYSSSSSNEDEEVDDQPAVVVTPVLSDEGNNTSYANATTSAVDDTNTTTITSNNETIHIINDTNTNNNTANETISSSTNNNTTNSTVFERRTRSKRGFVPTYEKPSSQLSPPSDEEPTIEISGEYTDIIHHNPQSINNNNNGGDIIIKDNNGNSLTITELLGFFNDSKLVFDEEVEEEEQYILYDSRQARFGTDLGPKGNAAFVNIMLPPRWGEDLDVDVVVDDGMGDVGEQQDAGVSESNSEIIVTNATTADVDSVVLNDQPIRGLQGDIDELLGLVDDESFDNNSTGVEGESGEGASNETEMVITETNHTDEITLFDDENANIDVVNTSTSPNDATDQVEEFKGEFDTHISSYFCLDDFINWRSKRSSSINNDTAIPALSSSTILSIDNLNAVNSTRGIALMVQRGRCSFQNKAELAMVFNDLLASTGKSNRIDNIIVYNNGTIDKTNNGTTGEEKLVEMLLVPKRNDTLFESIKPINVGMVYITTGSGRDLMHRMLAQENKLGISPYMDMSSILPARATTSSGWSRSLLINESTQNDGQHDGSVVQEDAPIHDETIANGWYFPATLTRFCLSCGEQTDYGFYPFALVGDSQYRPGQNPRPTWPPNFSDDYYTTRRWVEMIRRLMIAILVLLLVGPVVLATHRWHHVGGTIRWQTDENGRRRLRIISPNLELFVNGVHDAVETNGTKLDRAQVFALPEIVYNPSSSDSGRDVSENVCESPLMATESDAADGMSSDSFRENGDRCIDSEPNTAGTIEDGTPSQPAPISPSGSEASEMYESSTCCPICIEEFEAGEILRVLPRCKHLFHTECILPWLTKRQGCCPQCRTPVLPDEFQQRSRSPRSSPLRRSSGLSSTRRERDGQQTEESDTSLSGTRLFSGTEELPQQNQGSISVPHAAEVNESHPSHTENVNESSHELMEQGIASNEVPLDNSDDTSEAANENTEPIGQESNSEVLSSDNDVSGYVGITAVVSSDDIESNKSALAPIEDEEDTQSNIPDPPQISSVRF